MKFALLFTLAAAATASAAAVSERELSVDEIVALRATYPNGQSLDKRESLDTRDLEPRACAKSSCNCKGFKAGLFCGDGWLNCKPGYVYQCSGNERTCVFGIRKSCKQCDALKC